MAARKPQPKQPAAVAPTPPPETNRERMSRLMGNLQFLAKNRLERYEAKIKAFRDEATNPTGSIVYAISWKGKDAMIAESVLRKAHKPLRIVAGLEPMPETAKVTMEQYLGGQVEEIERQLLEYGYGLNQSTCPLQNVSTHCDHQAQVEIRRLYNEILDAMKEINRVDALNHPDDIATD